MYRPSGRAPEGHLSENLNITSAEDTTFKLYYESDLLIFYSV